MRACRRLARTSISFHPETPRPLAARARTSLKNLDVETDVASAHVRPAAKSALPRILRGLCDLWLPETWP